MIDRFFGLGRQPARVGDQTAQDIGLGQDADGVVRIRDDQILRRITLLQFLGLPEGRVRGNAVGRFAGGVNDAVGRIGIEATENATYRLHASTTGFVHASRYAGRVLCLEINRGLLAEPFSPFEEMHIGPDRVARMSWPIADALAVPRAP